MQFSLIVLNLYCDNYIQILLNRNAVQGHSFTTGMACIIKCGIDILNILRTELSNCHTIIFETLSVGKMYDKVKNTPRSLQKVNYICIYVDKKIVVRHQLLHC